MLTNFVFTMLSNDWDSCMLQKTSVKMAPPKANLFKYREKDCGKVFTNASTF